MHFGHLRQENENELVDKSVVETWKVFQKKLSEAADFVAQQSLIIKERLNDTFEVKLAGERNQNLCFWLILEIFEPSGSIVQSIDQWGFSRPFARSNGNG